MTSLWDANYVVIDVETNGTNPEQCRIIEIACVVVKNGTIVEEYTTLVNPHQFIPYFISQMTGITNEMVFRAPDFREVAPKIKKILSLQNSVFVAHNVNFDYNFVKTSFERVGEKFPEIPKLCTLKLARRMITGISKKNVGSLSEYLGITLNNRHRAYGDAKATAQILLELLEIAENDFNISSLEEILQFQHKPYFTINVAQKLLKSPIIDFDKIPDSPGVYYFIDQDNRILYIGKAKSLKKRLNSYFNVTTSRKILRLLRATKKITWRTTNTELRALIEESREIKLHKPEFNVVSKKFHNYPFIQIASIKNYPIFEITYDPNPALGECFGPFSNYESAQVIIDIIYKKFRLKKCEKEIHRKDPETTCLYFQTKQCIAPCLANFSDEDYFKEIEKVKNFLTNVDNGLINHLESKMHNYANNFQFELANQIKNYINEVRKVFEGPQSGFSTIEQKNFIILKPRYGQNNENEVLFIRNGKLAYDATINGTFSIQKLKQKIYEIYFNGYLYSQSFQDEDIDEIRIVLNWISQYKNDLTIIPVNTELENSITEVLNLIK